MGGKCESDSVLSFRFILRSDTSYIQIDDEIIRQCETLRKKKKIRFITINFRLVKFINMSLEVATPKSATH